MSLEIEKFKQTYEQILTANKNRHERSIFEGEKAHAYNVIDWISKLDPSASEELLAAGLFHDIDRILNPEYAVGSKFDRRSPEYFAHKKAHAKRSAEIAAKVLKDNGHSQEFCERVSFLITHHDDTEREVLACNDKELDVLVAADSLSYFDMFAVKQLVNLGEEQVKGKIEFMLSKMPQRFRKILLKMNFKNETINKITNETLSKLESK